MSRKSSPTRAGRWSADEIAFLAANAGKMTYRQIAQKLGRSLHAVKSTALRKGFVDRKRLYSAEEVDVVRKLYGSMPAADIAAKLGRTVSSVYQVADRLGVCTRQVPLLTPATERIIRDGHAKGWTDTTIGEQLGLDRRTLCDLRQRLGLPSNALSDWRRKRVAAKTREQLEAAGLDNLAQLRAKTFRERAREAGWPEDLRPRAVQILNALWDNGPMSRREIADAIGMPWKGSRKSLVSNDPEGSYLAHLMARGLVVSLGRVRKGKGKGHSTQLYTLPLWIERGVYHTQEESHHAA